MTAKKKAAEKRARDKKGTPNNRTTKTGSPTMGKDKQPQLPATPQTTSQAGGTRVDVTGIMPSGIRIDPDIMEGHPGYDESGDSEITPTERIGKEETSKANDSAH